MPAIEVRCICGKSYHVPPDKAGRRLQCRRCGNVQRVPRPSPAPTRRPASGGLRLVDDLPADETVRNTRSSRRERPPHPGQAPRVSLRRCPACGLQDEPGVVVCVRCGYDWRTGKRIQEADPDAVDDPLEAEAEQAQAEAERLGSMSWLTLSPLGVFVGPYVVLASRGLEARLRRARRHDATAALHQVRLTATAGAALWVVVSLLFGVLVISRSRRSDAAVSQACRQRLEQVGRVVRAGLDRYGELPREGRSLARELEVLLAASGSQGGAGQGLVCPADDGLYPYRIASAEVLTREASPRALLLWDAEAHPDELGRPALRALRCDGTVEVFLSHQDLERAKARPLYPEALSGQHPVPSPRPSPEVAPSPSPGPGPDVQRQLTRLLAYAIECDGVDPRLDGSLTISSQQFVDRLGLTPQQLLPAALGAPDPQVRLPAARLTARLTLPAADLEGFLEPLAADPLPQVRLVVALVRRRLGNPEWLPLLCQTAEDGDPQVRARALEALGSAAAADPADARRILEQSSQVRKRVGAKGDEAIFPLPEQALNNVASQLGGPQSREAQAVLFSAGAEALPALRAALEANGAARQIAALRTLDKLRRGEVVPLSEVLERLDQVVTPHVREAVLAEMVQDPAPPEQLASWCLLQLREDRAEGQERSYMLQVAATLPVARLVDDLIESGNHEPLLRLLLSRRYQADDQLEQRVLEVWPRLGESLRTTLVNAMGGRLHPNSVEVLIEGLRDPDRKLREQATYLLVQTQALRPPKVREDVARAVAKRLTQEKDGRIRRLLFQLAAKGIYCSARSEDEHVCDKHLFKALTSLAQDGDQGAIAALGDHGNDKVGDFLLRLLDRADNVRIQEQIVSALRRLTHVGQLALGADFWRGILHDQRDQIEAYQAQRWELEMRVFREQQEKIRAKLGARGKGD